MVAASYIPDGEFQRKGARGQMDGEKQTMRDGIMRRPWTGRALRAVAAVVIGVAVAASVVGEADARRAGSFGSFGSRGARTYVAPAPTPITPRPAAPLERTMTPRPAAQAAPAAAARMPSRSMFGGGFFGSMLGGLMLGGLIGMMFGHGFGGGMMGGGLLGGFLQIALIGLGVFLLMRFLGRRQQQGAAFAGAGGPAEYADAPPRPSPTPLIGALGGGGGGGSASGRRWAGDEIGIGDDDLDRFERLLTGIQEAYGAEDFAALRSVTTPEAMGFLSEELGANATRGVRNRVTEVRLLAGEVAEAWREDGDDYATVAMRFSSRDFMVDRASGEVVDGSTEPGEATELWTFRRSRGEDWKLAAIQQAA